MQEVVNLSGCLIIAIYLRSRSNHRSLYRPCSNYGSGLLQKEEEKSRA